MTAANTSFDRLARQIQFILEIDKLKEVFRRSYLLDESRHENSAEHSWHLAVMAVLLWEHAKNPSIDLLRILKMVIVHDIVEVDAGDTFIYDEEGGGEAKTARELAAAERLFSLLPTDQAVNMRALWEEFEAGLTREAKFANAIDRLEPTAAQSLHAAGNPGASMGLPRRKCARKISPCSKPARRCWPNMPRSSSTMPSPAAIWRSSSLRPNPLTPSPNPGRGGSLSTRRY